MTEFLKNVEFKEAINRASWMDSKTKEKALQKLEALRIRVAFPDEYEDSKKDVGLFYYCLQNFFADMSQ